jgi:predicted enzyme related to lactoylglutathione lyase
VLLLHTQSSDEANGSFAKQLQRVCHDTLPWLISFSLGRHYHHPITIKEFHMNQGIKTIIYPVKDIARAKTVFCKFLGVEPYADQPYYVGFKVGDQDIGLVPKGHNAGMTAFYHVDDIKSSLRLLLDSGAQVQQDVKDVGGGVLIASVIDTEGNIIGLRQSPTEKTQS